MARNIKLSQIGDYCEDQYEKLLRVTVIETDFQLKDASPTDSGRLRASWQIGENSAPGGNKPEGKYPYSILDAERVNYAKERVGNVYSIHNNVPYAEPVLMGTNLPASWKGGWRSKDGQIEEGYPFVIAKNMQDRVRQNADRIGRQS